MLISKAYTRFLFFALICAFSVGITEANRDRRSPFKKHRIVIDGGDGGGGWVQEPSPFPPPPPPQSDETIVNHHHTTVVEHHHHHHEAPPPPPPQYQGGGFRIEINKGKGGKGKGEKEEEIKKALDEAAEEIERDKEEKWNQFKGDVDDTFDFLKKIPEQFASDMDTIGKKIAEDIERKKAEEQNKGVSIHVWKGKGKGGHVGGGRGESTEVVHHHHYHGSEEGYGPPPPTQPPPPPPKKHYEGETYETYNKFGEVGAGFLSFLDQASSQFRVPVTEEEYSRESSDYGHGGKGKGFQFRVWKGGRRR